MARTRDRLESLRIAELSAFCLVAEKRSFVDAARALGATPSSTTRAVQAVEALVGQELISRTRRAVALTPAGESYYEIAKAALRQLQAGTEAVSRAGLDLRGWVRFSAPAVFASFFLPELLADIAGRHENLRLDVTYTDARVDPAQAGLDFAIRGAFPSDSDLIGQTLWRYQRYLCASPGYVAAHGLALAPGDLARHRVVMHTGPRILSDWTLRRGDERLRLRITPAHRVDSGEALVALVQRGLGIGRIASWIADPLIAAGRLVRVCPGYVVIPPSGRHPEIHAVYRSRALSRRARVILNAIRDKAPAASAG